MVQPKYPPRVASSRLLDAFTGKLNLWLKADALRGKRDRRSIGSYYETIRALGYTGGKTQVYNYCQRWRQEQASTPRKAGFVQLSFELGEAFQFDWSCE